MFQLTKLFCYYTSKWFHFTNIFVKNCLTSSLTLFHFSDFTCLPKMSSLPNFPQLQTLNCWCNKPQSDMFGISVLLKQFLPSSTQSLFCLPNIQHSPQTQTLNFKMKSLTQKLNPNLILPITLKPGHNSVNIFGNVLKWGLAEMSSLCQNVLTFRV